MYKTLITILLAILFSSCNRSDPWRNLSIKTGNANFNSSKLLYPATNFSHDLEIEFLYTAQRLHAYINVYSETIPPHQGDDKVAALSLAVKDHHYEILVDRLAGGQRLKIPEESLTFFINLLEKHSYVILGLKDGYKTRINAKDFKKHFKILKAKTLSFIPNDPITLAL